MTKDKQIIIDGVDVSGCPYYNYINKDGSCSSQDCECVKCIHNECFYKDYKRKEQECEELKKEINSLLCSDNCYRNKKLKQTLTEIKGICEFDFTMSKTNLLAKTILQKISECEVRNEKVHQETN